MKVLNKFNFKLTAVFLLITNTFFSNNINFYDSVSIEKVIFRAVTVDPISPTTGHAGTIVTINGSGFTAFSIVSLGTFSIPSANIQFISSTEIRVTVPCGVTSGYFSVNGVTSATLFNYIPPTISNSLTNLSYCVGSTVPSILLSGTPLNSTTTSGLVFNWINSNNIIGLPSNGTGNIPTFTALNPTLEPLTSTITVTPSINGCLGVSTSYTLTVNPSPVISPISDISVCAGSQVNQININALSPNSGSGTSFVWSGNNNSAIGLNTSSGTTSPISSFTALNTANTTLSSTFTVIPNFQGCVGNPINFKIDVIPNSQGGTLNGNNTVCSGSTPNLLSLTGNQGNIINWEFSTTGNAPWTRIPNTSSTYQPGILTQTTYYRVAVQNTGCILTYSNSIVIVVNNLPTITGNLTVCNGGSTTLIGSGSPALNAWQSLNNGIASISNIGLVTAISPGTTIITYTNSNGCSISSNFVVNSIPNIVTINPSATCSPNSIDLTLSSLTAGSSSGLVYTYFTNSSATNTIPNPNSILNSGTYYIKGTDANGCSNVNSVSIIINNPPIISILGNNSICENQSISLTALGGNTYSWSSGLGTSSTINLSPTITTTYTVNSIDINGCSGSASTTVLVKPLPYVNAGSNRSICFGTSISLEANGLIGNIYSWDNAVADSVSFIPTSTTTYTVTALGTNGCSNTSSVLVTVNPLPSTPVLNILQPNCTSSLGTIQISGLPLTGNWTIFPGSYNGTGSTFNLNNQVAGNYNYFVRDSNSCNSASATVTVNSAPLIPSIPTLGIITQPNCLNTNGSVVLNGLPIGNWTITKLPGNQTFTNSGNTYTVENLTSGTYNFSVSNGSCSSLISQNVVIDVPPTQSIGGTLSSSASICSGQNSGLLTLNGYSGTILRWEQSIDN